MRILRYLIFTIALIAFFGNSLAQEVKGRTGSISFDFSSTEAEFVWLEPSPGMEEVGSKNLKIRIGIKHTKAIDKIVIRHNSLQVSENYNFTRSANDPDYIETVEHQVSMVEGDNEILIAIKDDDGNQFQSKRSFVLVDEGLAAVKSRKNYALLFATNEYDDPGFNSLNNPVNDAADIAQTLRNKYGFDVDMVADPTYDSIVVKIRKYTEKDYDPYDQLFIFFAGHGIYDETFQEGFLVCKDTEFNDPSFKSYLNHKILSELVDNIPNQHIFLVLDACFSGTFDPEFGKHKGANPMYADASRLTIISRKLEYKTRRFITSGGKEYVPDGVGGQNSPFAAKLLEALRSDGGRDGIVTIADIITYVELATPQPKHGAFGSNQNPSEFVFEPRN